MSGNTKPLMSQSWTAARLACSWLCLHYLYRRVSNYITKQFLILLTILLRCMLGCLLFKCFVAMSSRVLVVRVFVATSVSHFLSVCAFLHFVSRWLSVSVLYKSTSMYRVTFTHPSPFHPPSALGRVIVHSEWWPESSVGLTSYFVQLCV